MSVIGAVIERQDGSTWRIVSASQTSDGFLLGTGVLLNYDGDQYEDEQGFPIIHSFFLGRAN